MDALDQNTIFIGILVFFALYVVSMLVYFMFRQYLRLRERELKFEQARLDDFRAHLERQLVELNSRFAVSEERWRDLNHLVIAGQSERRDISQPPGLPPPSEFLRSYGIEPSDLKIRQDLIFVLTPFHDDFADEFKVVAEVGRDLGFSVSRGDERVAPGEIFPQLLRLIVQARIVIANISGRNPNVFYELGIAHALDKSVILIAHNQSDIPFDVRAKRIIFYEGNDQLQRELEKMLARVLAKHSS